MNHPIPDYKWVTSKGPKLNKYVVGHYIICTPFTVSDPLLPKYLQLKYLRLKSVTGEPRE